MGNLPRSEYQEFSSDLSFLDSVIGIPLDFWYGDPDVKSIEIARFEISQKSPDYLLGYDKNGKIVFENTIPSYDCPYREVE